MRVLAHGDVKSLWADISPGGIVFKRILQARRGVHHPVLRSRLAAMGSGFSSASLPAGAIQMRWWTSTLRDSPSDSPRSRSARPRRLPERPL